MGFSPSFFLCTIVLAYLPTYRSNLPLLPKMRVKMMAVKPAPAKPEKRYEFSIVPQPRYA